MHQPVHVLKADIVQEIYLCGYRRHINPSIDNCREMYFGNNKINNAISYILVGLIGVYFTCNIAYPFILFVYFCSILYLTGSEVKVPFLICNI